MRAAGATGNNVAWVRREPNATGQWLSIRKSRFLAGGPAGERGHRFQKEVLRFLARVPCFIRSRASTRAICRLSELGPSKRGKLLVPPLHASLNYSESANPVPILKD